jgi:hypothetical protein
MLTRNALIINLQHLHKEIDLYCTGKPFKNRLRNGRTTCANAARAIVSILDHAYRHNGSSILCTMNAPLLATYILAIHSLKHPGSGLAKSDVEIQARAIQLVHKQRSAIDDNDPDVDLLLNSLQSQVAAVVSQSASDDQDGHLTRQAISTAQTVARNELLVPENAHPPPLATSYLQHDWNERPVLSGQMSQTAPLPIDLASYHMDFSNTYTDLNGLSFPFMMNGIDDTETNWDAVAAAFDLPHNT